uniref:Polyhomeotic-like protein 2 n=1 Tax=Strix occidentalis caurina TaxID=311401 RepID=A0A8D0KWM1_STROC
MENEQLPAPPPASSAGGTATTPSSTGTARPPAPQISVYSGIPDRQTVQQALHRQPNTAAQYLQQMYAAQQQHLMLQTAALQQQHLTSAQLQSLAAVQQVPMGAAAPYGTPRTLNSSLLIIFYPPQATYSESLLRVCPEPSLHPQQEMAKLVVSRHQSEKMPERGAASQGRKDPGGGVHRG